MSETGRPQPYVGVSGVVNMEQQGAVVDLALENELLGGEHFVMLGIQASSKTQILDEENKYGRDWYPVGQELSRAAGNEDSGLSKVYVHCNFGESDLNVGVALVMNRSINYLYGLQLNQLPWMNNDYRSLLHTWKHRRPILELAIQAHDDILGEFSADQVAKRLGKMQVDYVLFDASHGAGHELDVERIRPYVDAVYQAQLPVGVVVAGGLEASTMEQLFAPLAAEFPDLSCDAEGRLRRIDEKGRSLLDLQKVADYIAAWKQIVQPA